MLEFLAPGFLYNLGKDLWGMFRGRHLTSAEIVKRRQEWKPLFEEHIFRNYRQKLRTDAIIRDIKRVDSYPDTNGEKGISPWFRVELVGTYHRGILVALSWHNLVEELDGLRFANYKASEKGNLKALLIGRIRYEDIENVDWNGDEYYSYPHIYCFFLRQKEPYEDIGFYSENRLDANSVAPFYTRIDSYAKVRQRSLKRGIVC